MTWLVADYIKYYEGVVSDDQCEEILGCTESVFVPSTYSSNDGKVESEERVRMDEFWVKNDSVLWPTILSCYEEVIKRLNCLNTEIAVRVKIFFLFLWKVKFPSSAQHIHIHCILFCF